jgi:hypothetical protein
VRPQPHRRFRMTKHHQLVSTPNLEACSRCGKWGSATEEPGAHRRWKTPCKPGKKHLAALAKGHELRLCDNPKRGPYSWTCVNCGVSSLLLSKIACSPSRIKFQVGNEPHRDSQPSLSVLAT